MISNAYLWPLRPSKLEFAKCSRSVSHVNPLWGINTRLTSLAHLLTLSIVGRSDNDIQGMYIQEKDKQLWLCVRREFTALSWLSVLNWSEFSPVSSTCFSHFVASTSTCFDFFSLSWGTPDKKFIQKPFSEALTKSYCHFLTCQRPKWKLCFSKKFLCHLFYFNKVVFQLQNCAMGGR